MAEKQSTVGPEKSRSPRRIDESPGSTPLPTRARSLELPVALLSTFFTTARAEQRDLVLPATRDSHLVQERSGGSTERTSSQERFNSATVFSEEMNAAEAVVLQ